MSCKCRFIGLRLGWLLLRNQVGYLGRRKVREVSRQTGSFIILHSLTSFSLAKLYLGQWTMTCWWVILMLHVERTGRMYLSWRYVMGEHSCLYSCRRVIAALSLLDSVVASRAEMLGHAICHCSLICVEIC